MEIYSHVSFELLECMWLGEMIFFSLSVSTTLGMQLKQTFLAPNNSKLSIVRAIHNLCSHVCTECCSTVEQRVIP